MTRQVAVVIAAAGRGTRIGGKPKPFLELAGRSVLNWALIPFLERADVVDVVVALDPSVPDPLRGVEDPRVRTVAGGADRFESVARGLAALRPEATIVAVHDGARPFPAPETVEDCIRTALDGSGAVAGIPASDTVKAVDRDGRVMSTPDRGGLWYAQTPQVFPRALLEAAVAKCREAGLSPTDDASAVELTGGVVRMVRSSPRNLKITYPADLVMARALVAEGLT